MFGVAVYLKSMNREHRFMHQAAELVKVFQQQSVPKWDRQDKTVVLMAGDGGFMVNVGEMVTAAEENLPVIIVLFDDSVLWSSSQYSNSRIWSRR